MKMVWKTIGSALLCPVLFGCGTNEMQQPEEPAETDASAHTGYALPGPAFPVSFPDSASVAVVWQEPHPLLVVDVSSAEREFSAGDTLLLGSDPFLAIELDRIMMELELAEAAGYSAEADSLAAVLADSSRYIPVTSVSDGRAEIFTDAGETLQPGDTVAVITGPPPDSIFIVHPLSGQLSWPSGVSGTVSPDGSLVCSGTCSEDSVVIPDFYLVGPEYIHEEGLNIFLITSEGDTLPVTVSGSVNSMRMIHSQSALDSVPLARWH
ncbi:hypothetical protein CSA37_12665 [Candidatus Fermentibacteria bacterium]|nr:MAG: hypothetical protein CSA37_12665 [Candidatus Fermentibacteria bacterium]